MSRRPLRVQPRRSRPEPARFERLERRSLMTTFVVNTPQDSLNSNLQDGLVSLREAITAAILNEPIGDAPAGTPGLDVITFDLPDPSVPIRLVGPLPTITDSIDFDGTTQPGYAGTPVVELDGSLAGATTNGLLFDASNNAVRGLVISRFGGSGLIAQSYDNLFVGNYIGTDRTGTQAAGNGLSGLELLFGRNTVGGVSAAEGNLISANGQAGIRISGLDASQNQILGNRIGANATLDAPLPNGTHGVFIDGASLNLIGSAAPNFIWWNTGDGVQIVDVGVSQPSDRNAILGNSITGNGGLGIDLGGDGPTPNDPGDLDDGPNSLVNSPVLQSVALEPGGLRVQGVFDAPSTLDMSNLFRLEFFTDAGDPSNFGQGRDFLGAIEIFADPLGGPTNFSALLPTPPLGTLAILSATATGQPTGTSEFSANLAIPANLAVAIAPDQASGFTGDPLSFTVALRSDGPAPAEASVVTLTLPAGMELISAVPSRGTASQAGQIVTVDLGTLLAKETATVALQVRPTVAGQQVIRADFASATPDPDPADDTAFATLSISERANLAQSKTASAAEVLRGDELTFTLTTRNIGTTAAPGARVADTLPAGFRLLSAVSTRGTVSVDGQAIAAEFGTLEVGDAATLVLRVVADQAGTFLNSADATCGLPEADPSDNSATVTVTVDDFDLVVRNTNDDGRNSLRRALISAQRIPGADTVVFAIPGPGPHVIAPLSPLPTLTESLIINGGSQPTGKVVLDGAAAGATSGLVLATSDSEINGLTILGFAGSGISVLGDRNTIRSNQLGREGRGNALDGLEVRDGLANVLEGNTSSGNARNGVLIAGPRSTGNLVSNHTSRGNGEAGVLVSGGAAENMIFKSTLTANGTVGLGLYGAFAPDGSPVDPALGGRNEVRANTIGGPASDANRLAGLLILESPGNFLSGGPGTVVGGYNNIYGGGGIGVWIVGSGSVGNLIGNRSGISGGSGTAGDLSPGVAIRIDHGASNNSISGGNSITARGGAGIELMNGANNTFIDFNFLLGDPEGPSASRVGIVVGPGVTGTTISRVQLGVALGTGILLEAGSGPTLVTGCGFGMESNADTGRFQQVGLLVRSAGNTIRGNSLRNAETGILLSGAGASGNLVQSSWLTPTGGAYRVRVGIEVDSASANTIGGAGPNQGNTFLGLGASDATGSAGILLRGAGASGNWLAGNRVGLHEELAADLGNFGDGIVLLDAPGNTIGGTEPGAANVISGNGAAGLRLAGLGTTGNRILGNRIGTNLAGSVAFPNQEAGIVLENASANTIGGGATGEANVVSGNAGIGIELVGQGASGNLILGNRVGTNAAGDRALPNASDGIYLFDAPANLILGNVISGNGSVGVQVQGALAQSNQILSNLIGTNASGESALPNRRNGVYINDAPRNAIGAPGAGNLISGNGLVGVQLSGFGAAFNVVQGNLIGTNATGAARLPNGNTGVLVENAPANTIGGAAPGAGNTISGHSSVGVYLFGASSTLTVVQGNRIGTDAAGARAIANGNGVLIDDAPANLVRDNLISGNELGLRISGAGASGNRVQANLIGLAAGGASRLGNLLGGVFISGSPGNSIGGPAPELANTISANGGTGLQIFGPGAAGNVVQGNRIGTDLAGKAALGNLDGGVFVNNAPRNTIGGTASGQGNLIAGNREFAILVAGRQAQGNLVAGNQTSLAIPRPSRVRAVRRPGR